MATKLIFRVYARDKKRYLKGYKEATEHFLGIGNNPNDDSLLSISFDKGKPDTYYAIEYMGNEDDTSFLEWFHKNLVYCEDTDSFVHRLYKILQKCEDHNDAQRKALDIIDEMWREFNGKS